MHRARVQVLDPDSIVPLDAPGALVWARAGRGVVGAAAGRQAVRVPFPAPWMRLIYTAQAGGGRISSACSPRAGGIAADLTVTVHGGTVPEMPLKKGPKSVAYNVSELKAANADKPSGKKRGLKQIVAIALKKSRER